MRPDVFAPRRQVAADRCEHCDRDVDRVWLVPGDVLNSCRSCFERVTGSPPRHDHGHSSPPPAVRTGARASFHLRVDGRRPA